MTDGPRWRLERGRLALVREGGTPSIPGNTKRPVDSRLRGNDGYNAGDVIPAKPVPREGGEREFTIVGDQNSALRLTLQHEVFQTSYLRPLPRGADPPHHSTTT